jgi:hypothetical protein
MLMMRRDILGFKPQIVVDYALQRSKIFLSDHPVRHLWRHSILRLPKI